MVMDANRFFSVPYDNRNDITIRRMKKTMGGIAAYGRFISLLGELYDADGLLDLNDAATRDIVADELELSDVDEFFIGLCRLGLIDAIAYNTRNHVIIRGVCDELEYRRQRSECGKRGGRPRKKQDREAEEKPTPES